MKKLIASIFILTLFTSFEELVAGNKDRIGQAGATELLINPWAGSTGLGGSNTAFVTGIESASLNVAGLAFTKKTDVLFAHTNYLKGSEIGINALGIAPRIGESSVLGISIMAMNFGDIDITTVNSPEGGLGKFSPQFLNLGVSYAKEFSNSIFAGATVKTISESIANASARGVCFDLGVRYVTGKNERIKFGIALRNIGPKMKYSGDGLSTKVTLDDKEYTLEQRTEGFELPSLLSIGAAYDIYIAEKTDTATKETKANHKLTLCADFQSNSFGKDQLKYGAEYTFMQYFKLRVGYVHEEGLSKVERVVDPVSGKKTINMKWNTEDRTTVYSGPSAGFSVQMPVGSNKTIIGLDYSYQNTFPFNGTHSFGIRVNI